ncbi:hypothetical protein [Novipirellula artificiosorum]|uniref:hypothetical protein n=1 Tax=Novipirellula artificiosorum TaxID=2528016 RepID=UPI0011B62B47|nr:hypothetical protein [Novipirellula artificiosorum]
MKFNHSEVRRVSTEERVDGNGPTPQNETNRVGGAREHQRIHLDLLKLSVCSANSRRATVEAILLFH